MYIRTSLNDYVHTENMNDAVHMDKNDVVQPDTMNTCENEFSICT